MEELTHGRSDDEQRSKWAHFNNIFFQFNESLTRKSVRCLLTKVPEVTLVTAQQKSIKKTQIIKNNVSKLQLSDDRPQIQARNQNTEALTDRNHTANNKKR